MANVAVIDCGSNSTRLLIASALAETLQREMRITRLSAGVDASGHLSPDALERTYDTLALYRGFMDGHDVGRGLVVATSAVRDASNRAEFLVRASEITGVESRLLSGDEEAVFSYVGATRGLDADPRPTLVLDKIGRASCRERVYGRV